jgi:hypothetical protein
MADLHGSREASLVPYLTFLVAIVGSSDFDKIFKNSYA